MADRYEDKRVFLRLTASDTALADRFPTGVIYDCIRIHPMEMILQIR